MMNVVETRPGLGDVIPPHPGLAPTVLSMLQSARRGLAEAADESAPGARYVTAHLAALRAAAAVVSARAEPKTRRRKPHSVWELLPQVEPALTEWAAYFAAGAGKRAAAEAGLPRAASAREADGRLVSGSEPFHGAPRVSVEHAPADEFLREVSRRLVINDRERAEVFVPDGKDAPVVVAALALDGGDVAGERADLVLGQLAHALQVDDELGRRHQRRRRGVAGQQLGYRHAVELGQLGELLDSYRPVSALVGADDDGLPAAAGLLFNSVQRECLLGADGAQPRAERLGVLRWHCSSVPGQSSLTVTVTLSDGRRRARQGQAEWQKLA